LSSYLLHYRNTPVASLPYSPAQLLQSRELRTLVSNFNKDIFIPKTVDCTKEIKQIRDKQTKWYNKNAGKEENQFLPGSKVLLQDKFTKKW
jgi:hypothetical protein